MKNEFKPYKRKGLSEMRDYVPGEDLTGISVSDADKKLPSLDGGYIARNPKNHDDQWYVAEKYFNDNLEEAVTIDTILDKYPDEEFLLADGFDEAIIGVDESSMRLIYSASKAVEILARGMEWEAAQEFFEFNVSGSHVGEKTPIWCY